MFELQTNESSSSNDEEDENNNSGNVNNSNITGNGNVNMNKLSNSQFRIDSAMQNSDAVNGDDDLTQIKLTTIDVS